MADSSTTTNTNKPRSKETKVLLRKENVSLQKRASRWEAIGAIASRLDRQQPLGVILNEAARECAQALEVDVFCVMLLNEDNTRLMIQASVGLDTDMLRDIVVAPGQSLPEAAREGLPTWAHTGRDEQSSAAEKFNHAVFHALAFQGISLGVLCVSRNPQESRFDRDEMKVIFSLANQISIVAFLEGPARTMMERERTERDIHFAHALTREVYPDAFPPIDGYRLGVQVLHCLGTGGDFHDFISRPNGKHAILIGETSGCGMQAALHIANLLVCVRGGLAQGHSIGEVVKLLNQNLVERRGRGQLVSLALIELDPATGEVEMVRVGSTAAVLHRDGVTTDLATQNGTPLGILANNSAAITRHTLAVGAVLLLATDGLKSCTDATGNPYAAARIGEFITICQEAEAGAHDEPITSCIARKITEHAAGNLPEDDITLLVIERLDA